jgi:hypothetical protein
LNSPSGEIANLAIPAPPRALTSACWSFISGRHNMTTRQAAETGFGIVEQKVYHIPRKPSIA